jgi:glycosyltransferase involved in cell wall biosynthesis
MLGDRPNGSTKEALKIGISCFGVGLGRAGGVQVYLQNLLRALARHDLSDNDYVLIAFPDGGRPDTPDPRRFSVVELRWPSGRPVSNWRTMLVKLRLPGVRDPFSAQIDALGLDLVHYPGTRMQEFALRTPVVLTFFDMQEEFFPAFFPVRERIGRSLAKRRAVARARTVIAPTRFTAAALEKRYGTPREKIACIPAGVGPEFSPVGVSGERERLCARYDVPMGDFVFFPANPWPHKNHERLLRAVRRLSETLGLTVPLVCTGRLEGERRSIAAMAAAAGLDHDQVRDLGFIDHAQMPALFRAARLVAFPTLFEGFGLPVIEAMASGCPVACSDIPPLREIAGDSARYCDATREESVAEALAEVWQDAGLRAALAERGLVRAREFGWERIVPAILGAYEGAARSGEAS